MPVYLDCAATTPADERVAEVCLRYLRDDFGNAGSRTHIYGNRALKAVERARDQVAEAAGVSRGDVVFTSGATESNNLALLGLAEAGRRSGRMHLVATAIEHSAVLEPLQELARRGFRLTLAAPDASGCVPAGAVLEAVREDTLLVSVMHVNNETGAIQPLREIAEGLGDRPVYLHTDAAQGFAKAPEEPRHERIDMISVSAHKICGPKGVGALILRRRGRERPPVQALLFGGGHERGLRPGTIPVHLVAGMGEAAQLWFREAEARRRCGIAFRERLLRGLAPLNVRVHGDLNQCAPFLLNISIPGFDSEAVMEAWSELAAVSSGAACSSQTYTCSYVLAAMGLPEEAARGAIRFSWCHLTEIPDTAAMVRAIEEARER
jgi:cysteine desulfurase